MSGRCKACNSELSEIEMSKKNPENNQYTELCFYCLEETKKAEEGYYDNYFNRPFVISDFGIKETYKE